MYYYRFMVLLVIKHLSTNTGKLHFGKLIYMKAIKCQPLLTETNCFTWEWIIYLWVEFKILKLFQ